MGKKSKSKKPKPSAQEIALANVAKKKFDQYKRLYRPLAKEALSRSAMTEGKVKEAQGIVNADVQQSTAGRDKGIHAAGLRGGLAGSDSRVLFARSGSNDAIAEIRGQGESLAREGVRERDREGKLSHIALGHGIARQSMQSQTGLAQNATSSAIQRAQIKMQRNDQIATGLGQFFGAAAGMSEAGLGARSPTPSSSYSHLGAGAGRVG